MKKNLISIIVLGMVVANLVVSVMTLMTISTASAKVTTLISDISSVLALELTDSSVTLQPAGLSQDEIAVYNIEGDNKLTIPLRPSGTDSKQYVAQIEVSLLMDMTNPDYAKYGASLNEKVSIIKSAVNEVVSSHTYEEIAADPAQTELRKEILSKIQAEFGSTFIYQVNFTSYIPVTM